MGSIGLRRYFRQLLLACSSFILAGVLWGADLEPVTIRDFSAGLVTTDDPTVLPQGAAQALRNVNVFTGSVEKRAGSVLQNPTVLGSFTAQPIRFLHEYTESSGTNWLLSITSNSLYQSSNGGANNTLLTSSHGITSSSRFRATNAFNNAYLTDGTTNWIIITNSIVTASTIPPKGTVNAFFGERVWTGWVSGNTSVLYASRAGDGTDWTDGLVDDADSFSENIRLNSGYGIRSLKPFRNGLLVYKDRSLDLITLSADGLTPVRNGLSDVIGTIYHESVAVAPNEAYWLGHDGFYSYNGSVIKNISADIQPDIDNILQLNSGSRRWTQTSQADFQSDTVSPELSTTYSAGSVVFATGTLIDDFSDGDYTASPVWTQVQTVAGSTPSIYANRLKFAGAGTAGQSGAILMTTATFSSGDLEWNFRLLSHPGTGSKGERVYISTSGAGTVPTGYRVRYESCSQMNIDNYSGGSWVVMSTYSAIDLCANYTAYPYEFSITSAGAISVKYNGSVIMSTQSTTHTNFKSIGVEMWSTATGESVYSWDDFYVHYATGQVQTIAFNIGTAITSWGTFEANTTNTGNATQAFTLFGDTNTTLTPTMPTTYLSSQTITSGQTPTIATAAYVVVIDTFSRTTSSETATLSDFTLNWNEGSSTFPVTAAYFDGEYLCAVAVSSATGNDLIYIYDENGKWTIYDGLPAYILTNYRNQLYFGSNLQGDLVRMQAEGALQDYDGSVIDAYWESKDFDFGYPVTDKTMVRYYVTARYDTNSDAIFSYGVNRGTLTDETLDLDSVSGLFKKSISPASLTYQRGVSHRFKIADSSTNQTFRLLSVTMKPRLETDP